MIEILILLLETEKSGVTSLKPVLYQAQKGLISKMRIVVSLQNPNLQVKFDCVRASSLPYMLQIPLNSLL